MLIVGIGTCIISSSLILYSTTIESRLDIGKWQSIASHYYENEGSFEYTYNGFSLVTHDGPMLIKWKDLIKIESKERQVNDLRISCIDIFFSEKDFITVDSTINGFNLFEKRLKENMRDIWDQDQTSKETNHVSIVKKSVSIRH